MTHDFDHPNNATALGLLQTGGLPFEQDIEHWVTAAKALHATGVPAGYLNAVAVMQLAHSLEELRASAARLEKLAEELCKELLR